MQQQTPEQPIDILLIEDNPMDILLTKEAFKEVNAFSNIYVAKDGAEGLDFLYKRGIHKDAITPDLILMDLNMPRKSGKEVLAEIKKNEATKFIPVLILSTSSDGKDITECYNLHANGYISKPIRYTDFLDVVREINRYWLSLVRLPPNKKLPNFNAQSEYNIGTQ